MIETLFIGSNWEALNTLKTLLDDKRFDVVGLITQPDKPVGRKKELKETEIKTFAKSKGIEVYHTENKPDRYEEAFEIFQPELIVCKSFGEFLPIEFINAPKYKTINVHYSILPKYRGAVPIQKAILDGEKTTGITYVQMVEDMDAGPILKIIEHEIDERDTNLSLRKKLVDITSETIGDTLEEWVNGEINLSNQDEEKATYCWQKDINKENAFIDWEVDDPTQIERMVRALVPWPVAWTFYNEKRLKVFEAELHKRSDIKVNPGEYKSFEDKLYVGTKEPSHLISLKRVQLEGKSEIDGIDFARGQNL